MIDNKKGLNIDLTSGQYDYLYDLVMTAYELDIPEPVSYTHLTLPTNREV